MGSPLNSNVPDGHSVKWSESDNEQPDIQAGGAWPRTNPLHTFPLRRQNVLQDIKNNEWIAKIQSIRESRTPQLGPVTMYSDATCV